MIEKLMVACNNHFAVSVEMVGINILADGIEGFFYNDYVAGQHILIEGTLVNDGVYLIADVSPSKLTLDATLTPENTSGYLYLYGLSVPKGFRELATEIQTWVTKSEKVGIASESIDGYSVSFKDGGGWGRAFKDKLTPYRRIFNPKDSILSHYDIRKKG